VCFLREPATGGLHRRGMMPVFPEGAFPPFALFVFLCGTPSRQLYLLQDDFSSVPVMDEEMIAAGQLNRKYPL
jgi:hypothetical protein